MRCALSSYALRFKLYALSFIILNSHFDPSPSATIQEFV